MNDLISVVIPAYNVEKYLDKCLASVCRQSFSNLEIIVVNDGSTDETPRICKKWEKRDSRIIYISQKNKGLSGARNSGIGIATGKYIMFIDSDDWIAENMVETMLADIVQNDADISICNRYYINDDSNETWIRFKGTDMLYMDRTYALKELICMNNFDMSAWCKLYKKSLFSDIEFPEGKLCEDYYVMYKIFDKCNKIVYNPKPLLYYVQRNNSITKKKEPIVDYNIAAKEQMEYISEKYYDLGVYAKSAYALSFLTVYNKQVVNGVKFSRQDIREIKDSVRPLKKYVYMNDNISISRKIEMHMFYHFRFLYNIIIRRYSGR